MIYVTTLLAIAAIIGQGLVLWGFLRFTKSFGAYTESYQAMTLALLSTHESNLAVHAANARILEELKKGIPTLTQGVA